MPGEGEADDDELGELDGDSDGLLLGVPSLGEELGLLLGDELAEVLGELDGVELGEELGLLLGDADGDELGLLPDSGPTQEASSAATKSK